MDIKKFKKYVKLCKAPKVKVLFLRSSGFTFLFCRNTVEMQFCFYSGAVYVLDIWG